MSNYVTPGELREIAVVCELLDTLHKTLIDGELVAVDILNEPDGSGRTFPVYDSNGESVGVVGFGDSGYAFYPGEPNV